ncbi:hypothetical protein VTJ49DRAFT_5057 [Mycothermus thermophilus]|uniref:Citrate transporter-like domain-containing protein n=1 Tax=Humicola insolens TaxID=85995 RepID=A0ABR3V409_HUMIN
MAGDAINDTDTDIPNSELIKEWRSILTLVVFFLANVVVLFPFHIPIYIPSWLYRLIRNALASVRILPPDAPKSSVVLRFPMNMVTGPLIGDLFLLAIGAIGGREIREGTLGANNISPLDIMLFFISLAYIAISIDASGLIRFLALKVLQWGGEKGHRLFFYLYAFWFALTSFVGNDPVILSGTPFLAYMIRVSRNIEHGRAWLFSQFAVANIASAILVSSNPTNLVLAGAFEIRFIDYTANMIVPVILTGLILFPFLLHIVFNSETLVPRSIQIHQFDGPRGKPVNPNIPNARPAAENDDESVFNPFLDRKSAIFGSVVMAATLIAVLSLNAATAGSEHIPVYYIALPGAGVMFLWDISLGWIQRKETREISRKGREEIERLRLEQSQTEETGQTEEKVGQRGVQAPLSSDSLSGQTAEDTLKPPKPADEDDITTVGPSTGTSPMLDPREKAKGVEDSVGVNPSAESQLSLPQQQLQDQDQDREREKQRTQSPRTTLVSLAKDLRLWLHETFPTAMAVLTNLPYALVPFAFSMFVLVQALVTKGWVPIFAQGWDVWVRKTGPIGAISGMGLLSVILCNFSGTNIGTSILLSRVIQTWRTIHRLDGTPITERTFWATVYTMALGVNYGAFSAAFSASLAGLLWRDILASKNISVKRSHFATVNLPIIAISMTVGCVVLIGVMWITRDESPTSAIITSDSCGQFSECSTTTRAKDETMGQTQRCLLTTTAAVSNVRN